MYLNKLYPKTANSTTKKLSQMKYPVSSPKKSPVLALSSTQIELKNILRRFKSLTTPFSSTTNEVIATLFHLALFEKHRDIVCFLFKAGQKLIWLLALFWHLKLCKVFTLLLPKPIARLIIRQKGIEELLNQFSYLHCTR